MTATKKDHAGIFLDEVMRELAEYTRIAEEVATTLDSLKGTLKRYMEERGLDSVVGTEHRATYKSVISSRIDTAALKKDLPEVAAKYMHKIETKRFIFV